MFTLPRDGVDRNMESLSGIKETRDKGVVDLSLLSFTIILLIYFTVPSLSRHLMYHDMVTVMENENLGNDVLIERRTCFVYLRRYPNKGL